MTYLLNSFPGSFHPLLVHFPIAILVMAIGLDAWTARGRNPDLRVSLPVLYLWGWVTAALSCITGYLLSTGGEYEGSLVRQHQWLGMATALLSFLQWLQVRGYRWRLWLPGFTALLPFLLLILVTLTGHFGGSLTHGNDYLLKSTPAFIRQIAGFKSDEQGNPVIADVQQALAYKDLAAVIFRQKCTGCHGSMKQKGGLRLDAPEWILMGGKNGAVLVSKKTGESELISRLLLPLDDEDHMPPKEKPQLSREEIAYLHWWIKEGGDFGKKVSELTQSDSIKIILKTFERANRPAESFNAEDLPDEPKKEAAISVVDSLEKLGLLVMPLSISSRNLEISFLNCPHPPDSILPLLEPLSPQLVGLHLGSKNVTDTGLTAIGKLTRLRKLNLAHSDITDQGLPALARLHDLRYLNLTQTRVSAAGLAALKNCQKLHSLYLFGTLVNGQDWSSLKSLFPDVNMDSGGYQLPLLATDTELVKEKKK